MKIWKTQILFNKYFIVTSLTTRGKKECGKIEEAYDSQLWWEEKEFCFIILCILNLFNSVVGLTLLRIFKERAVLLIALHLYRWIQFH